MSDLQERQDAARQILRRLHHYIQPNQSDDPLLSTPFYEADVNTIALAMIDAYAAGIRIVADSLGVAHVAINPTE